MPGGNTAKLLPHRVARDVVVVIFAAGHEVRAEDMQLASAAERVRESRLNHSNTLQSPRAFVLWVGGEHIIVSILLCHATRLRFKVHFCPKKQSRTAGDTFYMPCGSVGLTPFCGEMLGMPLTSSTLQTQGSPLACAAA